MQDRKRTKGGRKVVEKTLLIPSEMSQVRVLAAEVMSALESVGLTTEESFDVKSALVEALTNAVKCQPENSQSAGQIWYRLEAGRLVIRVTDRGPGFEWDDFPDPTSPENLLKEGGRGVYLIRHLMDRTDYDKENRTLTMEKDLSKPRHA